MSIGQLIWRRFWINPRSPHEKYLKIQNRSNPSQRKSKAARSICYFFLYRLIVAIVNDFDIVVLTQCHYVYSSSCSFMASFFFFLIFTFNKDLHTNLRLKIHGLRFFMINLKGWWFWFDLFCCTNSGPTSHTFTSGSCLISPWRNQTCANRYVPHHKP